MICSLNSAFRRNGLMALASLAGIALSFAAQAADPDLKAAKQADKERNSFSQNEVLDAANDFFGTTSAALAELIQKAFKEQGRPNAYIAGEEVSGAVALGLRYGQGRIYTKSGVARDIYWQGPSLGLDLGGNAAKSFVLVYNLENTDDIYQRFPGVEGSLYVVGGFGLNYQNRDDITLAPIRTGVGLRAGANVGYLKYTREKRWLPF
jgi:hypothetical protein